MSRNRDVGNQQLSRPQSVKRMLRAATRQFTLRLPKPADTGPAGNVVMVTRSDLYPTDHGGAVKIVETARGLSHAGHEVGIVTDRRDVWWHYRGGELTERRYPLWLRMFTPPSRYSTLERVTDDVPLLNAFLYFPLRDDSYLWRTLYVARRLQANVYQAEFPAFARPCILARGVRGGRVLLVEHNVEYDRLREQEPSLTEDQYLRLKELEISLCNRSDGVICVSENDRRQLSIDGVEQELIHYIPHGVDLETFDRAPARDLRNELNWPDHVAILVYHGTYQYPPNLEAIHILAREVLPRLEKIGIDARVLAVGSKAPAKNLHPHVHFTGSVPVVAEALKAADVAVVPLLKGGGTRMKIIDYFACNVPVVSTSKGIEGIPVTPDKEVFIEDDWDCFCNRIEELINNPERRRQMVAAARAFVEPLDWRQLAKRYVEIFQKCFLVPSLPSETESVS